MEFSLRFHASMFSLKHYSKGKILLRRHRPILHTPKLLRPYVLNKIHRIQSNMIFMLQTHDRQHIRGILALRLAVFFNNIVFKHCLTIIYFWQYNITGFHIHDSFLSLLQWSLKLFKENKMTLLWSPFTLACFSSKICIDLRGNFCCQTALLTLIQAGIYELNTARGTYYYFPSAVLACCCRGARRGWSNYGLLAIKKIYSLEYTGGPGVKNVEIKDKTIDLRDRI